MNMCWITSLSIIIEIITCTEISLHPQCGEGLTAWPWQQQMRDFHVLWFKLQDVPTRLPKVHVSSICGAKRLHALITQVAQQVKTVEDDHRQPQVLECTNASHQTRWQLHHLETVLEHVGIYGAGARFSPMLHGGAPPPTNRRAAWRSLSQNMCIYIYIYAGDMHWS